MLSATIQATMPRISHAHVISSSLVGAALATSDHTQKSAVAERAEPHRHQQDPKCPGHARGSRRRRCGYGRRRRRNLQPPNRFAISSGSTVTDQTPTAPKPVTTVIHKSQVLSRLTLNSSGSRRLLSSRICQAPIER